MVGPIRSWLRGSAGRSASEHQFQLLAAAKMAAVAQAGTAAVFDILCPQLRLVVDKGLVGVYQKTDRRLWSYNCSGPANKIYSATSHYRRQMWEAWREGVEGLRVLLAAHR